VTLMNGFENSKDSFPTMTYVNSQGHSVTKRNPEICRDSHLFNVRFALSCLSGFQDFISHLADSLHHVRQL
jgi:hypothetical protein